jgi:ubiquinone biosynthesis protein
MARQVRRGGAKRRWRVPDAVLDATRVLLFFRVAAGVAWQGALTKFGMRSSRAPSLPRAIRVAMERLGVTYLKLGQYFATRFDLLPAEVYRELTKLFEDASPLGFDDVKTVLEAELAGPLENYFSEFDPNPIASASVAQVHQAYTIAGERVAVKVQRPGIERVFNSDLRNLRRLARLADRLRFFRSLSMSEIVDQFGKWTRRELDFRLEARTADRMAKNATLEEIVPRVFFGLTTARILTMEFVDGISLAKVAELLETGGAGSVHARLPNVDLQRSGRNLAFAALHQLFVTGVFHGDPHPGNILIRNDNRVAFVDFGIFGELSRYERGALGGYIENVAVGRIGEAFRSFARLTFPSKLTDLRRFECETRAVFQRWYEASQHSASAVQERHLGRYTAEIFDVVRRNHVRMSMDTLLFWRTLNALDSSALRLSKHFDLLAQLRGFFTQIRPPFRNIASDALSDCFRSPVAFEALLAIPEHLRDVVGAASNQEIVVYAQAEMPETHARREIIRSKSAAAAIAAGSLFIIGSDSRYFSVFLLVSLCLLLYAGRAMRNV